MTKQEFLEGLGLSSEEFRDLMQKFGDFVESLNEAQQGVVRRSMPTVAETSRSFGPKMTPKDLERVLAGLGDNEFVMWGCFSGLERYPNPGRPIAPHPPKPKKPKP
jgi:hypothetical protein